MLNDAKRCAEGFHDSMLRIAAIVIGIHLVVNNRGAGSGGAIEVCLDEKVCCSSSLLLSQQH